MRGFQTKSYFRFKESSRLLVENTNHACWAGIRDWYASFSMYLLPKKSTNPIPNEAYKENLEIQNEVKNKYKRVSEYLYNFMYIDNYTEEETKQYINLLVDVINKITPCRLISIKIGQQRKKVIRYTLLETYDQNLILLNFIRNLWHSPFPDYSVKFFEELKANSSLEEPLRRLLSANKKACEIYASRLSPGHSNVHPSNRLVDTKTTDDLKNYKGYSTREFLTTVNK